jgi:hypothetical protein
MNPAVIVVDMLEGNYEHIQTDNRDERKFIKTALRLTGIRQFILF